MSDCDCDDDMTEDGHSHACPNSIGARLAAEYERGIAEGERRERALVVQYLVDRSKQIRGVPRDAVVMLMQSADAIERGEHEREGT